MKAYAKLEIDPLRLVLKVSGIPSFITSYDVWVRNDKGKIGQTVMGIKNFPVGDSREMEISLFDLPMTEYAVAAGPHTVNVLENNGRTLNEPAIPIQITEDQAKQFRESHSVKPTPPPLSREAQSSPTKESAPMSANNVSKPPTPTATSGPEAKPAAVPPAPAATPPVEIVSSIPAAATPVAAVKAIEPPAIPSMPAASETPPLQAAGKKSPGKKVAAAKPAPKPAPPVTDSSKKSAPKLAVKSLSPKQTAIKLGVVKRSIVALKKWTKGQLDAQGRKAETQRKSLIGKIKFVSDELHGDVEKLSGDITSGFAGVTELINKKLPAAPPSQPEKPANVPAGKPVVEQTAVPDKAKPSIWPLVRKLAWAAAALAGIVAILMAGQAVKRYLGAKTEAIKSTDMPPSAIQESPKITVVAPEGTKIQPAKPVGDIIINVSPTIEVNPVQTQTIQNSGQNSGTKESPGFRHRKLQASPPSEPVAEMTPEPEAVEEAPPARQTTAAVGQWQGVSNEYYNGTQWEYMPVQSRDWVPESAFWTGSVWVSFPNPPGFRRLIPSGLRSMFAKIERATVPKALRIFGDDEVRHVDNQQPAIVHQSRVREDHRTPQPGHTGEGRGTPIARGQGQGQQVQRRDQQVQRGGQQVQRRDQQVQRGGQPSSPAVTTNRNGTHYANIVSPHGQSASRGAGGHRGP